jgi:hypothetical protein
MEHFEENSKPLNYKLFGRHRMSARLFAGSATIPYFERPFAFFDLFAKRCRLQDFGRMNFPVPETLTRFFALECVFCFIRLFFRINESAKVVSCFYDICVGCLIVFRETSDKLFHFRLSECDEVVFTTSKSEHDFERMSLFCEFFCLLPSDVQIVVSNFVGNLQGFYIRFFCACSTVRLIFLLLEEEFSIIHNLAENHSILHTDFNEVFFGLFCFIKSLIDWQNSVYLPLFTNYCNVRFTNLRVEALLLYSHYFAFLAGAFFDSVFAAGAFFAAGFFAGAASEASSFAAFGAFTAFGAAVFAAFGALAGAAEPVEPFAKSFAAADFRRAAVFL